MQKIKLGGKTQDDHKVADSNYEDESITEKKIRIENYQESFKYIKEDVTHLDEEGKLNIKLDNGIGQNRHVLKLNL